MRDHDLRRAAIVFSPHPDDETLGCGGTIIRKKQLGARVTIVFMTDGSNSHNHLIVADELAQMRKKESLKAAQKLSMDERDIILLGFKDGTLRENQEKALRMVSEIIAEKRPGEIFIPYFKDSPPDHLATHSIVLKAAENFIGQLVVNEYPIWFWNKLPWTRLEFGSRSELPALFLNSFSSTLSAFRDFTHSTFIGDVLLRKRAALDAHRSQMFSYNSNPKWLTLHDVAGGDFLHCFFQEREVFHQYKIKGKR